MHGVTISELIQKMKLKNTTRRLIRKRSKLTHPDVNRPALQLTGFLTILTGNGFRSSDTWSRHMLITMDQERKRLMYDKLTSSQIPCLVFSRNQEAG